MYEDKTYAALLAEGLGQVRDDILKSEGSLVYNAMSVIAYELARLYIQADYMLDQIDPETADYEHLVMLCARKNIYPDASDAILEVKSNSDVVVEKIRKYAEKMIFGFDFVSDLRKAARMNMVMAGDGHANIFNINSLE